MQTARSPEAMNDAWKKVYTFGFGGMGGFLSLLSFLLVIIWLCSEQGGGLDTRDSSGVTAGYFNWHPLMMSCAFLALMTPATSAFEVLSACSPRAANKNVHSILQTAAIICIVAAYAVIWDCHTVLSDTGLANSMHSIVGYIAMAMVGLTYLMGFCMYVLKWGGSLRGTLKPLHKRMGFAAWMLGMVALLMGMTEKANGQAHIPTLVLTQVITGLVVFTAVFVSFTIVKFEDKSDVEEHKYTSLPNAAEDEVTTIQRM